MALISFLTGLVFVGIAIFTQDPVMDARAWVIAPMFIAASFVCLAIELREVE